MRGLFLEGNDVGYSQDFHYHRGVPAGVYEVTETANGWKLTAPGYGDKAAYGNGALRLSKESNPVFPGTLFLTFSSVSPLFLTLRRRPLTFHGKFGRLVNTATSFTGPVARPVVNPTQVSGASVDS